jgi:hypothetical protein
LAALDAWNIYGCFSTFYFLKDYAGAFFYFYFGDVLIKKIQKNYFNIFLNKKYF